MNCTKCNTELTQNYCPNCGQAAILKRIDSHYIIHEIEHVLHFERGILYTIKELCIHPGKTTRNYIKEDRNRLVKPVIFIIVTSLIYTLIAHYFHIEEHVKMEGLENSSIATFMHWSQANYGYSNILLGGFIAIWLQLFFKKYGYNFYEVLIMMCFILGISMLIFAVFALLAGVFHFQSLIAAGVTGFIYLTWASANFFKKNKIGNYFKAFSAYLLGTITLYIVVFAVGLTIDYISKP